MIQKTEVFPGAKEEAVKEESLSFWLLVDFEMRVSQWSRGEGGLDMAPITHGSILCIVDSVGGGDRVVRDKRASLTLKERIRRCR